MTKIVLDKSWKFHKTSRDVNFLGNSFAVTSYLASADFRVFSAVKLGHEVTGAQLNLVTSHTMKNCCKCTVYNYK